MKGKKVKQILALSMTVVMFMALLGGCSGKSGESGQPQTGESRSQGDTGGQDSQEELYMIDVIPAGVNQDSTLDTTVGKEIADRFGIGFNFIKYTGDMQEKQAAMLASGDYNELQCMQTTAISDQYIQAGVLDPELFTDNHDMTVEKMSNGSAIAVWYVNWNNKTANQALTEAGHPEMSYITQPIQLDSQKGQKFVTTRMFLYPFNQYGVTDKCKDPEKLLKFLNWCCTEEGQLLLQNGLEGVHYEIQDGERVPTDLYLEMLRDVELQNKEGLPGGLATGSYEMFQCLSYDMSVAEDFEKAYGEMLAEYEMLDYQSVIDARNEMLGEIMEQLAAGNE